MGCWRLEEKVFSLANEKVLVSVICKSQHQVISSNLQILASSLDKFSKVNTNLLGISINAQYIKKI